MSDMNVLFVDSTRVKTRFLSCSLNNSDCCLLFVQPVYVHCIGEGPVIHLTPSSLDWGQIQVLTEVSKIVKVSNESLIPAHFTAEMVCPYTVS